MKNLRDIAEKLLNNSDFVSSAMQIPFPPGNCQAAETTSNDASFSFYLDREIPEGDNT